MTNLTLERDRQEPITEHGKRSMTARMDDPVYRAHARAMAQKADAIDEHLSRLPRSVRPGGALRVPATRRDLSTAQHERSRRLVFSIGSTRREAYFHWMRENGLLWKSLRDYDVFLSREIVLSK